jgi:hypothetical protein
MPETSDTKWLQQAQKITWNIEIKTLVGESILNPWKFVVTNIIFLQLSFLVTYGHYISDYFGLF